MGCQTVCLSRLSKFHLRLLTSDFRYLIGGELIRVVAVAGLVDGVIGDKSSFSMSIAAKRWVSAVVEPALTGSRLALALAWRW